jgi:hypothetical protein
MGAASVATKVDPLTDSCVGEASVMVPLKVDESACQVVQYKSPDGLFGQKYTWAMVTLKAAFQTAGLFGDRRLHALTPMSAPIMAKL